MLPADLPVRITIDVDGSGGADMIKRHPLVIFTLLTFGLTWIVWVPRAAGVPVGALGYSYGPGYQRSPPSLRLRSPEAAKGRLRLGRLVRWRVAWWWYPRGSSDRPRSQPVVAGVYAAGRSAHALGGCSGSLSTQLDPCPGALLRCA